MHLLIVGWLTLRPVDAPWVTAANLRPLAGIRADFAVGTAHGVRSVAEGLALLAPLGVLLPVVSGRLWVSPWASLTRTVGAGVLISLTIQLLQTGVPGRVLDIDSLILNTVGVAVAHAVVVPLGRARLRRGLRASAAARSAAVAGAAAERAAADPGPRRPGTGRVNGYAYGVVDPRADVYDPDAVPEGDGPQGPTPTIPRVGLAP
ncbi:VanZ family protein [Streptomyces sp. NBC_01497]|uniref:VanZ family protein n=1 Tax=Streptomyces sp. NBC_01497 TaxID=2903885 RepID=UPI002E370F51|nr:VanZ family protein [Streptomyces sp. NBC_01497]